MNSSLRIAAVQATPFTLESDKKPFEQDIAYVLSQVADINMLVYPELHLFHAQAQDISTNHEDLRKAAIELTDPMISWLGELAAKHKIWLIPGSICEKGPGNEIYNTALVFNPEGDLVTHYRKIFPWRPFEPFSPGDSFVVFDVPQVGRFGINICYDSWFPEVSRNLAWLGAEIIINLVKTTTPDRAQEIILARANSIINQVFTVSVNTAGPVGFGQSLIVGPEGEVLAETSGTEKDILVLDFRSEDVERVRSKGTAGTNRMWDQFRPEDKSIPLPIYNGFIDPKTWKPKKH